MKNLKGITIILGFLVISDILVDVLNLSIPGTILGMFLFLVSLLLKIIKLDQVEDISNILLKYLGMFFVPAGVAIVDKLDLIKSDLIKIALVLLVTTIVVMIVTAKTVDFLLRREEK